MNGNVGRHCKARYGLNNSFFTREMVKRQCTEVAQSTCDGTVIQGMAKASNSINTIHHFLVVSIELGNTNLKTRSPDQYRAGVHDLPRPYKCHYSSNG